MKLTILIPTYRRPQDLSRCLEGVKKQTRPADEVLVVVRDTDSETWKFLATFDRTPLPLRTVTVIAPGQVAALNAGVDAVSGDIVAITDDDAMPHPDWLARIEAHFLQDDRVGGVGGRDWVYNGTQREDGTKQAVGLVQWAGRLIGNHHLGVGGAREVDILKGANMSYRTQAIDNRRFDTRLRGTGSQIHNDLAFSLALKRAGWKLIYDPLVAVNHYAAQRFDEDQRNKFNSVAFSNIVHNETLALLEHLPPVRRAVFILWAILIGTRDALGLMQWLRLLPSEGTLASQKWLASLQGRWQGFDSWLQHRRELVSTYLQNGGSQ